MYTYIRTSYVITRTSRNAACVTLFTWCHRPAASAGPCPTAPQMQQQVKATSCRPKYWGLSCHVTHLPVHDIAATSNSSLPSEAAAIAAFEAPPQPIRMDGLDFTSFHAFHRAGSNVETGADATAKTILLSIRSEIRKDQSVLRATRKYLGPCGCLSFLVVQTIAHLEEKMKNMMVDADGDGKVRVCAA